MYAFVYIRLKIFVTKYTDCFHVNHSKYTGRNNHKKDGRGCRRIVNNACVKTSEHASVFVKVFLSVQHECISDTVYHVNT